LGAGLQAKETVVKCSICKNGKTSSGRVTVTLQRAGATVIVKEVPADVCDNCGEYYLHEDVAKRVFEVADQAVKSGAEVEIRRYAA
jgi:YgiT-type zinc finger domain-containing protein